VPIVEDIERVMPMATRIAASLGHPAGSHLYDELMGAARVQLVCAWPRYDVVRGARWTTFAWTVIRRAMLDQIRDEIRQARPATSVFSEHDHEVDIASTPDREFAGVDLVTLLPRLYRRALKRGPCGLWKTGIPKRESKKVYQWAVHALRSKLDNRL
jgi:DNA-directed RNA polymerase specialized sigma subunit